MTSAFIVSSGDPGARLLPFDLEAVGITILGLAEVTTMVEAVVRAAPDLVVCYETHPGDALFAGTAALRNISPRPVIVFTTDPDADKIERAIGSGIQVYVINGYASHRLRSVIHVAQARFKHDQLLRDELTDVQHRFSERKLTDRAKGILMRVRNISEDEAYRVLRTAAMQSKQRIGQIAQQVIDAARYAEAVNRAGQLRMLSQRLVKLYALMCADVTPEETATLCRQSLEHIEANVTILRRTLSKATFGDLLDAALTPWGALKAALTAAPKRDRIIEIDALAERLLTQSEALVRTLEMAGFAGGLHVINVSGRQRMLSQRIAKEAVVASFAAEAPGAVKAAGAEKSPRAAEAERAFIDGLAFLKRIPLSTPEIRALLAEVDGTWDALRPVLDGVGAGAVRATIAVLSETMLAQFEQLTGLYERSMQVILEPGPARPLAAAATGDPDASMSSDKPPRSR